MKLPAIFLGLLSLLVPVHHAFAAESTPDFSRFEKEITDFEKADRLAPPPKGAVLFIGASRIRLWSTLQQEFPDVKIINRAFGGSDAVDLTHFAPRMVFPYEPRAIYISTGNNDLARGKSVEQVVQDIIDLFKLLRAKLPDTDIIFISMSPSVARWKQAEQEKAVNARIAAYITVKPRFRYIDTFDVPLSPDGQPRPELYADRLHLNGKGYKLFAARLRPDVELNKTPAPSRP